LAETAGKFVWILTKTLLRGRNLDHVEYFEDALLALFVGHVTVQEEGFSDLATNPVDGVERRHGVLGNQGDFVAANFPEPTLVKSGQVLTVEEYGTASN
jgi:hypothetical protein